VAQQQGRRGGKNWGDKGVLGITRLLGASKLLFALGADDPRYATERRYEMSRMSTRSSAVAVIADRTACSILTLFIVTATSRPVNKKNPFGINPRIQELLRICVRNPHSARTCSRVAQFTALCHCDKRAVPFR